MENKYSKIKQQKEQKVAKNIYILIIVIVLASALFFISIGKSIDNKKIIPDKYQEINSNSISK